MEQTISIFISTITGIIVAFFTWKFQMRTELSKKLENYVSDKKYKAYYNAVIYFIELCVIVKVRKMKML